VAGHPLVWDFVRSNWKKLFENYGGGSFSFANLIQGVTRRFSSEFELQQLEQFKADNSCTQVSRRPPHTSTGEHNCTQAS
ncbi:ERAP1-like C-terminal domain-containing protein, partial [Vibrio parahaemolyticus]|nr:ERAP1-like C-terminal domain-containing protein [Vibrio parahaemolyticus]